MKIKIFTLFILFSICLHGQTDFRPGFIITNDLDTVHGKVDYRTDKLMGKVCTFKTKESGKKKYSPGEIFAYRFENDRFFETANVDGNPVFLELLIKGEVSIYHYNDDTKSRYFLKKGGGEIIELEYSQRVVHFDEYGKASDGKKYVFFEDKTSPTVNYSVGAYSVKTQEFKITLHDSLQDVPELLDEINSLEKPDHAGLMDLAKNYHELKCNNQDFIVYHDLRIKSEFAISVGWIGINYGYIPTDETYLMYSFKGFSPLSNSKFLLGYGIQYSPIKLNYYSYKIFRIPLSAAYQYPGNIFKPHAAIGLNVYFINDGDSFQFLQNFVPSYNIGFAVKVYKAIHLYFEHEGDLCWDTYYNSSTKALFSRTTSVGLMISF